MFSLAVKWELRSDNPIKGIERNAEEKRKRYLKPEELQRLTRALAEEKNEQAANAVRLLLLTGARRGEVLGATWDQFDLAAGTWVKPGATTKQKTEHRVPLSAPTLQLLAAMRQRAKTPFLFPAGDGPMRDLKKHWTRICRAAGLAEQVEKKRGGKRWQASVRVHDLRHSYASILASAGLSLPVIGALLGHTQPSTTARYAHLFDDPLRQATERVGAIVTGIANGESAEVVDMPARGKR
jgi:integrase